MRIRSLALAGLLLAFAPAAPAAQSHPRPAADVLTLEDGSQVAVTIDAAKSSQADVFVLINGLEYATTRWDEVAEGLNRHGATVIRYALPGQPENLKLLAPNEEPGFFKTGLEMSDMVHQLEQILKAEHVTQKIHLVGLSYGASVAAKFAKANPELVQETTFISPLVVPLDGYTVEGSSLRNWLDSIKFWEQTDCDLYGLFNPLFCSNKTYWYDKLYEQIYQTYLMDHIAQIPEGVDPTLFKKSIYHLVRAARDFDLTEDAPALHKVSMLVASEEETPLAADQRRAYERVPDQERVRFTVFKGAHHALPDEAPEHVVKELLEIAKETN